jgi:hypothetical protein
MKILMILMILGCGVAEASQKYRPDRPLPLAERRANTVRHSALILVGRAVAGRDTNFTSPMARVPVSVVDFEPVRAIKGRLPAKPIRFLSWGNPRSSGLIDERPSERHATWRHAGSELQIVCLERQGGSGPAPAGSAWSVTRWSTSAGWFNPSGIARWRWWTPGDEQELIAEVARQSKHPR